MAIHYSPDHPVAKEHRKWEYGNKDEGYRGERTFEEYPKRMYRAARDPQQPRKFVFAPEDQVEVGNSLEESNMRSRGFHVSQLDAVKALEASETEVSRIAANRAYNDRHMSDAARAEADAADLAAGDQFLAEVPVTPVKRGRKPKAVA